MRAMPGLSDNTRSASNEVELDERSQGDMLEVRSPTAGLVSATRQSVSPERRFFSCQSSCGLAGDGDSGRACRSREP